MRYRKGFQCYKRNILTIHIIEARRPDIVSIEEENKQKRAALIDFAIPGDVRVEDKEEGKLLRYEELGRKLRRMWHRK